MKKNTARALARACGTTISPTHPPMHTPLRVILLLPRVLLVPSPSSCPNGERLFSSASRSNPCAPVLRHLCPRYCCNLSAAITHPATSAAVCPGDHPEIPLGCQHQPRGGEVLPNCEILSFPYFHASVVVRESMMSFTLVLHYLRSAGRS